MKIISGKTVNWIVLSLCVLLCICSSYAQTNKNRYAIQNVATGKDLRPYEAGKADGNRIILYNYHSWKCLTWEFEKVADSTFTLKNRYTLKTFVASNTPTDGVSMKQLPLSGTDSQQWEFIKQVGGDYRIRLKGTDLYVTISKEDTNSDIVLSQGDGGSKQLWKLIPQDPFF